MKKYLIIYHKEDNDGVFSAAIVTKFLQDTNKDASPIITYLGADYVTMSNIENEDIEDWANRYDSVIMTDISANNPKIMKKMYDVLGNRLIWIDHHAPAIKSSCVNKYNGILGERQTDRSAILLAFKFFFDPIDEFYSNKDVPRLFRILSAWDSFTYEKEGFSLDFVNRVNIGTNYFVHLDINTAVTFAGAIIDNWNWRIAHNEHPLDASELELKDIEHLLETGTVIVENDKAKMKHLIEDYGDFDFKVADNRSACALFIQGQSSSLMFESIKDTTAHGIVFKRKRNGQWTVSLYNTDTKDDALFHCGEYLKKNYGGGGHAGAAGCTITEKQMMEILASHHI